MTWQSYKLQIWLVGCIRPIKNVWKSDRRWEPENFENLKTWKLDNLKTLKTLKNILGTCWTTFVFMSMLKSRCKFVKCVRCVRCVRCVKCVKCSKYLCWSLGHNEQLLFSCLCSKVAYMWNVKCQVVSFVKCQVSDVKCLSWSLGHAEQLLFSCLGWKLSVSGWKCQWFFLDSTSLWVCQS